jgi:enoyl-CoA hydratase
VIDAAEAKRIGLVDEVVPKAELDAFVQGIAKSIATLAPLTIEAAKVKSYFGCIAPR